MLQEFLEMDQELLRRNLDVAPEIAVIFQTIARFYRRIEEGLRDTREACVADRVVLLCLFHESFKFWLNSVAVLLRGHLTEFLPLLRGALESAAYAHKIRIRPELAEVWLQREERRQEFNEVFRDGGIERQLFPEDDRLVRRLWSPFDHASTFGVHSNHERLTFSIEVIEETDGHTRLDFLFGSDDLGMIRKCAGFCATVAYRMLEVFRPCFEDITGMTVWTTELRGLEVQLETFVRTARGQDNA